MLTLIFSAPPIDSSKLSFQNFKIYGFLFCTIVILVS
jgi:hypothetical protein